MCPKYYHFVRWEKSIRFPKRHLKCWVFSQREDRICHTGWGNLDQQVRHPASGCINGKWEKSTLHLANSSMISEGEWERNSSLTPAVIFLHSKEGGWCIFVASKAWWLLMIRSYPTLSIWLSLTSAAANPTRWPPAVGGIHKCPTQALFWEVEWDFSDVYAWNWPSAKGWISPWVPCH